MLKYVCFTIYIVALSFRKFYEVCEKKAGLCTLGRLNYQPHNENQHEFSLLALIQLFYLFKPIAHQHTL